MFLNWTWVFGRRRPHFSPLTICSTVHSRLCELKIIGFIKKFFSANLKVQRDTRGTRRGNGSWPRHIFDLKNLGDKSVIDDSFGVKGELMYQRINKEKLSSSGSLRKWFSFSPDERQIHGACSSTENYLSIYIYITYIHIYICLIDSSWLLPLSDAVYYSQSSAADQTTAHVSTNSHSPPLFTQKTSQVEVDVISFLFFFELQARVIVAGSSECTAANINRRPCWSLKGKEMRFHEAYPSPSRWPRSPDAAWGHGPPHNSPQPLTL